MMIDNLILDMGNVLLSFEPERYVSAFCRKEAREIILRELFLSPDWAKQDMGLVGKEELYEIVKLRVPREYHQDLFETINMWSSLMEPVEGAMDFLLDMKKAGRHLYVLSNAGKDFFEYFPKRYDLSLFDGVMVSCDLHILKPDRRIYEALLQKYRLDPERCLFMDDTPRNVAGAEQCGIHGYLFTGGFDGIRELLA